MSKPFVLDLYPRYQRAFGFIPAIVTAELKSLVFGSKFSGSVYVKNEFCFSNLELKGDNYNFKIGNNKLFAANATSEMFVGPPMISVSRSKNISVTSPDRSESEVVENFSRRSWEIKLKGIAVDMSEHHYPQKQVKELRRLFDIDGVLEAVCQLLNDLGIYYIYFTDIDDIGGVEGFEDTIYYSLTARSFNPPEFSVI